MHSRIGVDTIAAVPVLRPLLMAAAVVQARPLKTHVELNARVRTRRASLCVDTTRADGLNSGLVIVGS